LINAGLAIRCANPSMGNLRCAGETRCPFLSHRSRCASTKRVPAPKSVRLEHLSIRLCVARVCEISFAFFFGNPFEKRAPAGGRHLRYGPRPVLSACNKDGNATFRILAMLM
jgi:hypothetical protein